MHIPFYPVTTANCSCSDISCTSSDKYITNGVLKPARLSAGKHILVHNGKSNLMSVIWVLQTYIQ